VTPGADAGRAGLGGAGRHRRLGNAGGGSGRACGRAGGHAQSAPGTPRCQRAGPAGQPRWPGCGHPGAGRADPPARTPASHGRGRPPSPCATAAPPPTRGAADGGETAPKPRRSRGPGRPAGAAPLVGNAAPGARPRAGPRRAGETPVGGSGRSRAERAGHRPGGRANPAGDFARTRGPEPPTGRCAGGDSALQPQPRDPVWAARGLGRTSAGTHALVHGHLTRGAPSPGEPCRLCASRGRASARAPRRPRPESTSTPSCPPRERDDSSAPAHRAPGCPAWE